MEEKEQIRCKNCGLIIYRYTPECPRCFARIERVTSPEMESAKYTSFAHPPTAEPKESKLFINKKRLAILVSIIIIVAVVLSFLSYYFILPRTEIKIITVYREASGMAILIDTEIENVGTLEIKHFTMNISVMDENDDMVAEGDYYLNDLGSHDSHGFDNIYFKGDQYLKYRISIKIKFESSGKEHSKNFDHTTSEYMWIKYEDHYLEWGG